ncbi:unnamed protein product [Ilex paraguariensis]|uniref:Uncharacterized protein n=1 Tax=Ilex paraguariensis TaxID=185542 RepID=A0ABC8RT11_9AQUA
MEEKQLDLNAPLLSVRRFSSTLATSDGVHRNTITKSPPPNRQHSLPLYTSDWELGEVTKPAAVPFLWEHTPGRPKYNSGPLPQLPEESSNTPRLSLGTGLGRIKHTSSEMANDRHLFRTQTDASPLNDYAMLLDSLIEGIKGKGDSDLESGDDAYSDALDTLSPTQSFSLNYSVSGLSGYDGPDVKPSGTFSTDPQTRDFMMSRFLPAAKAMVLETPQYVPRRQPAVTEPPRQVKKVVSGELRPLLEQFRSNAISPYGKCVEDVESEDEDECDDPGKKSRKVWGLFPRICVKNSACLLNPVPGLKPRAQTPKASASKVNRLARTAYSGPLTQTIDKNAWNATYRKQLHPGVRSQELHEVESKLVGEFKLFSYSGELYRTDRSSPCRRLKAGGISPYRNEAPVSPFHDGARFLGIPKEVENAKTPEFSWPTKESNDSQNVSSHLLCKQELGSVHSAVEKTLYIDSIRSEKIPVVKSVCTEADRLMDCSGEGFKTLVESTREETFTPKASIQDTKCLNLLEGGRELKPKASVPFDANLPSMVCIANLKGQAARKEVSKRNPSLDQESRSLECSKVKLSGNLDKKNEHTMKADDKQNPKVVSLQSPLTPPLPKSPSESWLWHTLPSISLRNPFSHSHSGGRFHSKKQDQKTSINGTKWETIVKTSNLHHDHVRYSEELMPHVRHHSKT